MKPIETRYKGYRFRSRLEARWAVFFDAAGLKWEYEKEGFDLGAAGYYLPDFYLPDIGWIEIKGQAPTKTEQAKVRALEKMEPAYLIEGDPWPIQYSVWHTWNTWKTTEEMQSGMKPSMYFMSGNLWWIECFGCGVRLMDSFQVVMKDRYYCMNCDNKVRPPEDVLGAHGWFWHKGQWANGTVHEPAITNWRRPIRADDPCNSQRLMKAYNAARGARFEHRTPTEEWMAR